MKRFFTLFIALLIGGCSPKEKSRISAIDIDMSSHSTEALFSDFNYIKLETDDKCLLNYIEKITLKGDTVVIHSLYDRLIALYSVSDGHFIYRFPLGNGPDEIRYPVDVEIDDETGNLWILDSYKFSKEFSLGGKFLNNSIETENGYMKLGRYKGTHLLFDPNSGRENPYYFEIIKNGEANLFVEKDRRFHELLYIPTSTFCSINDSILFFYHQFEDVIYSWNNNLNEVDIAYDIIYKNGKSIAGWNGDHVLKNERNGEYQQWYDNKEYIFGMKNLYNFSHNLFFTAEDSSVKYCLYNRENSKLTMSLSLLNGFPEIKKIYKGSDKLLLFTLAPEQILEFINDQSIKEKHPKLKQLSGSLSPDDNPVLFMISV